MIPNEVNRHWYAHNHTHIEQTEKLHSTNSVTLLTFSTLSKGWFMFSEKKIITSPIFRPEYIQ